MVRLAGLALILAAAVGVGLVLLGGGPDEPSLLADGDGEASGSEARGPELAGVEGAGPHPARQGVEARPDAAAPPRQVRLRPRPPQERAPVPFRMLLKSASGRPLGDVTVRLYRGGRRVLEGLTDREGRLLADLPAGRYAVHAVDASGAAAYVPAFVLDGGEGTGLALELGRGPALSVRFVRGTTPIASIAVRLVPGSRPSATLDERLARTLATVATDADGTATFPSVAPGTYDLIAQLAGGVYAVLAHTHPDEEARQVRIGDDVTLTGRVTDGWDGPPVSGAALTIGGSIGPVALVARPTSGADGRFALQLPTAAYDTVRADATGWLAWPPQRFDDLSQRQRALGNLPRLAQGRSAEIHVPLTRLDGPVLIGRVVDAAGAPVGAVPVVVAWDEYDAAPLEETIASTPDGTFAFETLRPGSYRVWVEDAGWHVRPPVAVRIPPDTRASTEIVVPVTPAGRLAGRVLLPGGAPAAAARVWLASALRHSGRAPAEPGHSETFTDGDGVWELGGMVPGSTFVVRAARGDLQSEPQTVSVDATGGQALALRLLAAPGLSIRVVEVGSRAPVRWADVRVEPVGEPTGRVTRTYRADVEGRIEIPSLLRAPWRLTPASEWHRPAEATALDLSKASGASTVELTLDPGLAIAGRVLDKGGEPAAATVRIAGGGEEEVWPRPRSVSTNEQGFFRATGLAWGTYTVTVEVAGHAPIVQRDLHGGEELLVFTVGD